MESIPLIASLVGMVISLYQPCKDYFSPPSKEELEARNLKKKKAKQKKFSRISIRSEHKSERLPGIADASLDSGSAFFAAFASHALHAAIPVSRAGLIRKGKTPRLVPARSTTDRATVIFHSNSEYRVQFRGFRSLGNGARVDDVADEIFRDLIRPFSGDRSNEISIISSEIGCGKSTVLSNLLYRINFYQSSQTERRLPQTLPVEVALISFDELDLTRAIDTNRFMNDLVKPWILDQLKRQTNLAGRTFEEVLGQGRTQNVVLLFDDMDGVYRAFCRDFILTQDNIDSKQGSEFFFHLFTSFLEHLPAVSFHNTESGVFSRCVWTLSGCFRLHAARQSVEHRLSMN